jgi:signal transduction histidine kinase
MDSLFGKIFIAFWLTMILLGGVMVVGERSLGERELEQSELWLNAHAETAATLLQDHEHEPLERWLRSIRREEGRPVLMLNEHGDPVLHKHLPPNLLQELKRVPMESGSHRLRFGHYLVLAQVPGGDDLFLATMVDPGHLHNMPPWLRGIIALLITGLVSFGLANLLSRRVRRLRHAAQALADGDLSVRVGGSGSDEVAALGRDFDVMAERLREMLESQRQLLRDVSHELRSPLARLRIALELAEKDNGGSSRNLQRVEKEADELERLIGNLLSLARLESGQSSLEQKPVPLAGLLEAITNDADFEAQAQQRNVQLTVEQVSTVKGDPVLLRSAIENVVRNAVRYTAEGTTVEVWLGAAGSEAVIQVRDHGSGVPEPELKRMFEPFARVGEARDRDSGGYGLGLAITGKVMAAHNGVVNAWNSEEGGLCVELCIPLAGE